MEISGQRLICCYLQLLFATVSYLLLVFLLQFVNFPNANLLVFLFPGFIVIPKPSQLSQWNSSIATIFLLLKNPATQSLMLLFTLQALQVFLFFDTPPCPIPSYDFVNGFSVLFRLSLTSPSGEMKQEKGVVQWWTIALMYYCSLEFLTHFRVLKIFLSCQISSDCCPLWK